MNSAANSHSAHLPQVCSLDSPVLSKSYSIAPASRPRYPERVSAASMVLPATHRSREHSKDENFSLTACVLAGRFFPFHPVLRPDGSPFGGFSHATDQH